MKGYYLLQFAFWLQQILVINMEERRKDHWQMFTHHIITSALVSMSYSYYQTKVGNVILCLMDVVDIFLAVSRNSGGGWRPEGEGYAVVNSFFPHRYRAPSSSNISDSRPPATSALVFSSPAGSSHGTSCTLPSAGRFTQRSRPRCLTGATIPSPASVCPLPR